MTDVEEGIETALQRLEAGELGTCSECLCRISDARLRALPFATLCLACRDKADIAAVGVTRQPTAGWPIGLASSTGRTTEQQVSF